MEELILEVIHKLRYRVKVASLPFYTTLAEAKGNILFNIFYSFLFSIGNLPILTKQYPENVGILALPPNLLQLRLSTMGESFGDLPNEVDIEYSDIDSNSDGDSNNYSDSDGDSNNYSDSDSDSNGVEDGGSTAESCDVAGGSEGEEESLASLIKRAKAATVEKEKTIAAQKRMGSQSALFRRIAESQEYLPKRVRVPKVPFQ